MLRFSIIIFFSYAIPLFAQNKKSALSIEVGLNKSYANLYYKPNSYNMFKNPFNNSSLGPYQIKSNITGYYFSLQYKLDYKKLHLISGLRYTNKQFDFIQNQFFDSVIGSIYQRSNLGYIELPILLRFYNKQRENVGLSFYGGVSFNYLLKRLRGKGNAYYWNSFDNPPKGDFLPTIYGPSYKENRIQYRPKFAISIYAEYRNNFFLGKKGALTIGYTKDLAPAMKKFYRISINHRIYEAEIYPVFSYAYISYKYQLAMPKFLKRK